MSRKNIVLLILFGYFHFPILIAEDILNLQNISIQADEVLIDKKNRQLAFQDNIQIKIDSFIIKGSNAILTQEDEKLTIYGDPTSIQSKKTEGEAKVLVIYPNKSMDLVGNAKLITNGNLITSDLITYQITSNE